MSKQSNIKNKIKEQYGKIALAADGSLSCCSSSSGCCGTTETTVVSPIESSTSLGYNQNDLKSIPQSSILGLGCGNPSTFAHLKEGDVVVDLGSGAGIDVFIAANIVKDIGKVIGIDLTDAMLEKARKNAQIHGYQNVEFRKGDIEEKIPVEDNSADLVISNCVINLTTNKENTFREIYRILKQAGKGKMVISDLVTSKEMDIDSINTENWCSCIDGALTKENYINSIKKAGFTNVEILDEKLYMELDEVKDKEDQEKRQIISVSIKAVKE